MKLTPLSKIMIVAALSVSAYWFVKKTSLLATVLSGAAQRPSDASFNVPGNEGAPVALGALPVQQALRFAGSNTIGAELLPSLAEAYLQREGASAVRREARTGSVGARIVGDFPNGPRVIEIAAHGTSTGFDALRQGSADVAMASRRITDAELDKLKMLGDMTAPSHEHVLALDGVAVIVHADQRLSALDVRQVASLFVGELSDYSRVGAGPGAIRLYARDDASGTFDTFSSLVLRGRSLSAGARRYEDGGALVSAVAQDVGGIGFVSVSQATRSPGVRTLAIAEAGATPLLPTRLTVGTEDYPLSRRLYLYLANQGDARALGFVQFALSKAGQELVTSAGFVSLTPSSELSSPQSKTPPEYKKLTQSATRLTTNFRFRAGASDLDNRALRDLDRVAELMIDLDHAGEKLLLLGFSDSTGSPSANEQLSQSRAERVAAEFAQRGLHAQRVRGFGSALAVADNSTPEGREKNRRVEVWLERKR